MTKLIILKFSVFIFFYIAFSSSSFCQSDDYSSRCFNGTLNSYSEYVSVITNCTGVIFKEPNNIQAYYNRAVAKYFAQDYMGSIEDYSNLILIDPNNDIYYLGRGMAKQGLKDYTGSVQDYSKVIFFNSTNASAAYYERATVKIILEDYRGAIDDLTSSIQLDPNKNSYFWRGMINLRLGNMSGCLDLSKSGDLGEQDAYLMIKKYCNSN